MALRHNQQHHEDQGDGASKIVDNKGDASNTVETPEPIIKKIKANQGKSSTAASKRIQQKMKLEQTKIALRRSRTSTDYTDPNKEEEDIVQEPPMLFQDHDNKNKSTNNDHENKSKKENEIKEQLKQDQLKRTQTNTTVPLEKQVKEKLRNKRQTTTTSIKRQHRLLTKKRNC
eukprot:15356948-Ditylum_brightwellii.AAC.2